MVSTTQFENSDIEKMREELNMLNEKKNELIKEITSVMKQIKYRNIELNVLKEMAQKAEELNVNKLVKTLRKLEFRVQTAALTPKVEKKYLKKIIEIERKLKELEPYLIAQRRVKVLEKEVKGLEEKAKKIEEELKNIRKKIKELMEKRKKMIKKKKKENRELVSLEEIVEIE